MHVCIRTARIQAGMCLNTSRPQSWSWKKPGSSHRDLVMAPKEDSQPQGRRKPSPITAARQVGAVQGSKQQQQQWHRAAVGPV